MTKKQLLALALVCVGAVLIASGVAAIFWPAGVITLGTEVVLIALFLVDVDQGRRAS